MSNEPTPTNYRLIDGVFSTDDARNILMTLINNKIQFHEQDSWSRKNASETAMRPVRAGWMNSCKPGPTWLR